MREPEEIEDVEYEQAMARVAAIDVAKSTGMVCTRVPHPTREGRRLTKAWEVFRSDERTSTITVDGGGWKTGESAYSAGL